MTFFANYTKQQTNSPFTILAMNLLTQLKLQNPLTEPSAAIKNFLINVNEHFRKNKSSLLLNDLILLLEPLDEDSQVRLLAFVLEQSTTGSDATEPLSLLKDLAQQFNLSLTILSDQQDNMEIINNNSEEHITITRNNFTWHILTTPTTTTSTQTKITLNNTELLAYINSFHQTPIYWDRNNHYWIRFILTNQSYYYQTSLPNETTIEHAEQWSNFRLIDKEQAWFLWEPKIRAGHFYEYAYWQNELIDAGRSLQIEYLANKKTISKMPHHVNLLFDRSSRVSPIMMIRTFNDNVGDWQIINKGHIELLNPMILMPSLKGPKLKDEINIDYWPIWPASADTKPNDKNYQPIHSIQTITEKYLPYYQRVSALGELNAKAIQAVHSFLARHKLAIDYEPGTYEPPFPDTIDDELAKLKLQTYPLQSAHKTRAVAIDETGKLITEIDNEIAQQHEHNKVYYQDLKEKLIKTQMELQWQIDYLAQLNLIQLKKPAKVVEPVDPIEKSSIEPASVTETKPPKPIEPKKEPTKPNQYIKTTFFSDSINFEKIPENHFFHTLKLFKEEQLIAEFNFAMTPFTPEEETQLKDGITLVSHSGYQYTVTESTDQELHANLSDKNAPKIDTDNHLQYEQRLMLSIIDMILFIACNKKSPAINIKSDNPLLTAAGYYFIDGLQEFDIHYEKINLQPSLPKLEKQPDICSKAQNFAKKQLSNRQALMPALNKIREIRSIEPTFKIY